MTRVKASPQTATGSVHQQVVNDQVAQERRINAMKMKFSKVHKNLALGALLMQIIYAGWRQKIKSETQVKDVLERYPFLQNNEEVKLETTNIQVLTGKLPNYNALCVNLSLTWPTQL